VVEAIEMCEQIADRKLAWDYSEQHRAGDHIWWISSLAKFQRDYPEWTLEHDVRKILQEIYDANAPRWTNDSNVH
jgi:CDP-paratose 2-epimerase